MHWSYCSLALSHHYEDFNAQRNWTPFCRQDFQMYFLNENYLISIQISVKFAPEGSIDKKLILVPVMVCHMIAPMPVSTVDYWFPPQMLTLAVIGQVTTQSRQGIFQGQSGRSGSWVLFRSLSNWLLLLVQCTLDISWSFFFEELMKDTP